MAVIECNTINGVRAQSAGNMVTGPGKLFFNVDKAALENPASADPIGLATANALEIGVTRGGSVFNVAKEMRPIEFDGKRGETKGLTVKESEDARLTVNFAEITKQNLMFALAGADFQVLANGLTIVKPGTCLRLKDYIDNVFLIATHGTRQNPIGILLEDILNMADFELSVQDRDEVNPNFEFAAHYTPGSDIIPYSLYISNEEGFYGTVDTDSLTADGTAGGSDTTDLTIDWILGYPDDVDVSLLDAPTGIALTGDPVTVANGTAIATTLTITVAAGTFAGKYVMQLQLIGPNQITQFIPIEIVVT